MTVTELISSLAAYDPNAQVLLLKDGQFLHVQSVEYVPTPDRGPEEEGFIAMIPVRKQD